MTFTQAFRTHLDDLLIFLKQTSKVVVSQADADGVVSELYSAIVESTSDQVELAASAPCTSAAIADGDAVLTARSNIGGVGGVGGAAVSSVANLHSFLREPNSNKGLSHERFVEKLRKTPASQLPTTVHRKVIVVAGRAAADSDGGGGGGGGSGGGKSAAGEAVDLRSAARQATTAATATAATLGALGSASPQPLVSRSAVSRSTVSRSTWLISSLIGGDAAVTAACASEPSRLKLVPMAGVATRLPPQQPVPGECRFRVFSLLRWSAEQRGIPCGAAPAEYRPAVPNICNRQLVAFAGGACNCISTR
jgi:hypothetical protein